MGTITIMVMDMDITITKTNRNGTRYLTSFEKRHKNLIEESYMKFDPLNFLQLTSYTNII